MVNLEIKHLKLKQSFCSSERHLIKYTPISMPQWTDGHNKFPLADYKVVGCSKLFGKQVECYICKLLECELLLLFCFSMLNDFFTQHSVVDPNTILSLQTMQAANTLKIIMSKYIYKLQTCSADIFETVKQPERQTM